MDFKTEQGDIGRHLKIPLSKEQRKALAGSRTGMSAAETMGKAQVIAASELLLALKKRRQAKG